MTALRDTRHSAARLGQGKRFHTVRRSTKLQKSLNHSCSRLQPICCKKCKSSFPVCSPASEKASTAPLTCTQDWELQLSAPTAHGLFVLAAAAAAAVAPTAVAVSPFVPAAAPAAAAAAAFADASAPAPGAAAAIAALFPVATSASAADACSCCCLQ